MMAGMWIRQHWYGDAGRSDEQHAGLSSSRLDLVVEDEAEALVFVVRHNLLAQSGVCLLRKRALHTAHEGGQARPMSTGVRQQPLVDPVLRCSVSVMGGEVRKGLQL